MDGVDELTRSVRRLSRTPSQGRDIVEAELRSILSLYPTGVTVVGAQNGNLLRAMTASSFGWVSLAPPLVLVCIRRSATMCAVILRAEKFAVSVLAVSQEPLARHFADPRRPSGGAQFAAIDWWPAPLTGAPMLAGALAWVDCCLDNVIVAGDHNVLFGRVVWAAQTTRREPLIHFARGYRCLLPTAPGAGVPERPPGPEPSKT
jgi:flavin reductase (DIM6/NTAB) family NADH-FMN oxidoreductase RutF